LVGFFLPPPTPPEIDLLFFYICAIVKNMANIDITCIFSEPLMIIDDFGTLGEAKKEKPFQFSKMICTGGSVNETLEIIQGENQQFYLQKTFSYGDFFVIFFLTLFTLLFFFSFIFNFIFKKRVTFRK